MEEHNLDVGRQIVFEVERPNQDGYIKVICKDDVDGYYIEKERIRQKIIEQSTGSNGQRMLIYAEDLIKVLGLE